MFRAKYIGEKNGNCSCSGVGSFALCSRLNRNLGEDFIHAFYK
jgi:hypothetical protein